MSQPDGGVCRRRRPHLHPAALGDHDGRPVDVRPVLAGPQCHRIAVDAQGPEADLQRAGGLPTGSSSGDGRTCSGPSREASRGASYHRGHLPRRAPQRVLLARQGYVSRRTVSPLRPWKVSRTRATAPGIFTGILPVLAVQSQRLRRRRGDGRSGMRREGQQQRDHHPGPSDFTPVRRPPEGFGSLTPRRCRPPRPAAARVRRPARCRGPVPRRPRRRPARPCR